MTKYATLFSSAKLGNLIVDNRIGLAPMTRTSATETGTVTEEIVRYYTNFAKGGFSFLIAEGAYTDLSYSQGYFHQLAIANEEHVEAWKQVTESVHQAGAKIILQLMQAGSQVTGNIFKSDTIGPSSVAPRGEKSPMYGGEGLYPVPREMTLADIEAAINSFVQAAVRSKEAGFDGVELHGASGYLLDQFLTDYTNQRTDPYGGSPENRVRLLVETAQAVREAVGPDFVVGIRISQFKVGDYWYTWTDKEREAEVIFSSLGRAGLDYIHLGEYNAAAPAFEGCESTLSALAKKYSKITVIANGQLEDPEKAELMLTRGEADLISIGKAALTNPNFPQRIQSGKPLADFDPQLFEPRNSIKAWEL